MPSAVSRLRGDNVRLMITLDREEILRLPYGFLCTARESASWNTSRRRRLWKDTFTESEREQAEKIFRQCHQWYLVKGIPDEVTMSVKTRELWMRLENFCATIFC